MAENKNEYVDLDLDDLHISDDELEYEEDQERAKLTKTPDKTIFGDKEKKEHKALSSILSKRPPKVVIPTEGIQNEETSLDASASSAKKYEKEGFMFKKQLRTNKWRKYYFHFEPSNLQIMYYRTKEDMYKGKEPQGSFLVTWMTTLRTTKEDKLVRIQVRTSKKDVCTWRLRVFSPKRVYTISAETDQIAEEWIHSIKAIIKASYPEDQMTLYKDAALKIEPLYQKQVKQQLEEYRAVLQCLKSAGIFDIMPSLQQKRKEGYLEIAKASGAWKNYYCILWKHSFTYFNLDDKQMPRGIIALDSISVVRADDGVDPTSNTNSNNRSLLLSSEELSPSSSPNTIPRHCLTFTIVSPVRTFHCRAKHNAAMGDWILAIQKQMRKENHLQDPSLILQREEAEISGQSVNLTTERIVLEYLVTGRKKTFKMKKPSVVIGRSSKSDLCLDKDGKVSRNHCRIELTPNGVPVLYDLGSMSGTYYDGKKIDRVPLKSGDEFSVGETVISFQVMKK